MSIVLYGHSGSFNHGCEAIVRSTAKLIKEQLFLCSDCPHQDKSFGIDKIVNMKKSARFFDREARSCNSVFYYALKASFGDKYADEYLYAPMFKNAKENIYLSIGGDTYCYDNGVHFQKLNAQLKAKGGKTVLWGCSILPKDLETDEALQSDIASYDLITARESISYNALKKINSNTVMVCDSAFLLSKSKVELPQSFIPQQTIGINISPLIQRIEAKQDMVYDSYCNMLDWIFENTNEQIVLISHVSIKGNDDMEPLTRLYNKYKSKNRIIVLGNNYNCEELKYIISNCSFFVGARTHATIAAYSSFIPTLVCGYSTKAVGIAKDLFGSSDDYVVHVQDMQAADSFTNAFIKLWNNRHSIAQHLKNIIPEYSNRAFLGVERLFELSEENKGVIKSAIE